MENATKEQRLPKGISKRADGRYQGRFTFQGERFTLYDRDIKALQKKMSDAKYEMEMADFNLKRTGVRTLLIPAPEEIADISSTRVRDELKQGNSVEALVPEEIKSVL